MAVVSLVNRGALILLVLATSIVSAISVRTGARPSPVTGLPGWAGPLRSSTYSGYFNISETAPSNAQMYMHYMLFESESDPVNDPIIVWWNGGPGATSMWGIFVENGPYMLNDESFLGRVYNDSGIPALVSNPFSWTKFATVVSFANPPPVGFSYCDPPGPPGNGFACGTWNDTRVAVTNAEALRILFDEHFPHLLDNPNRDVFFIGESYAGVYISTTTREVVTNARYQKIAGHLAGVALGDACLGTDIICGGSHGPYHELMFLYGHGQFPTEMWNTLTTVKCTMQELKWGNLSPRCNQYVNQIMTAVGGYYGYNLYDTCPDNFFATQARRRPSKAKHHHGTALSHREAKQTMPKGPMRGLPETTASFIPPQPINFNGYWCPGGAFEIYMNLSSVRTALNVPQDSAFFEADNGNGMNYIFNERNVMPFLASLVNALPNASHPGIFTKKKVRLMSYNGDSDPSVEMFATQDIWYAFAGNNSFVKSNEWRSWTTGSNVVGGYVVDWKDSQLSYVTVRGSGHMIPEFKPLAARVLIEHWIHNLPLPPYNP
mgnify:FL=1